MTLGQWVRTSTCASREALLAFEDAQLDTAFRLRDFGLELPSMIDADASPDLWEAAYRSWVQVMKLLSGR